MNDILKTKWIWRFAKEEDALWRKVTATKFGVDNLGGGARILLLMGWVVGNPSYQVSNSSNLWRILRLEMVLGSCFVRMFGVVIVLLRLNFRFL